MVVDHPALADEYNLPNLRLQAVAAEVTSQRKTAAALAAAGPSGVLPDAVCADLAVAGGTSMGPGVGRRCKLDPGLRKHHPVPTKFHNLMNRETCFFKCPNEKGNLLLQMS